MKTKMKGQTVGVHYIGTLEDGTVFDDSRGKGSPMFFKIGERQVIKGFENAVVENAVFLPLKGAAEPRR